MAKKPVQAPKSNAAKRSLNADGQKPATGAPFNDQDPERRLGNFTGAGEHSRRGSRTTGIGGQTKQRNATDNKLK